MGRNGAKALAKYHKFTIFELYNMLVEALDTYHDNYWGRANPVNRGMDNGYYFNFCRRILDYREGENDNDYPTEIVTVRVLQGFGEFSKVQIPKKQKPEIKIFGSEKPTLERK